MKQFVIIHSESQGSTWEPGSNSSIVNEFYRPTLKQARDHFKDLRGMKTFSHLGDGTLFLVEVLDAYRNA